MRVVLEISLVDHLGQPVLGPSPQERQAVVTHVIETLERESLVSLEKKKDLIITSITLETR